MPEEITEIKRQKSQSVTPRELLFKYLKYLPWLLVSLAITLTVAYLKLHFSVPTYLVSGKLLVNKGGSSYGTDKFDDIFMSAGDMRINDEIEIIKSRTIAARVIEHLGIQTSISNKGKVRNTLVHPLEAPFFIDLQTKDTVSGFGIEIQVEEDGYYIGEGTTPKHYFGELIDYGNFKFRILRNNKDLKLFGSNIFIISRPPLQPMASGLSTSLTVMPSGDYTNVLRLSYETENIRLGVEIINQFMYEYQQYNLEDKREIASNALKFITQQLDTVKTDLGGLETNLQKFRETSRVIDPEQQATVYFGQLTSTDEAIATQAIKLRVANMLLDLLSSKTEPYKIVPSMLGTEEPVLLQQITEYNKLQLERETALRTTLPDNPLIKNLETGIERLRNDMITNLKNVRETYQLVMNDLTKKLNEADKRIGNIPAKEKQLLEVTRQQNILQELYSFLLQKKLETAIGSASTISNIKVVESGMGGGQVSPNPRALYMMAFLIGIGIPAGLVALVELLNDKVKTKADIQNATETPILGEVGHAEDSTTLIVTKNNRKFLAEQFRIIRSNLQYILPKVEKPVILITSSFSGEGKSFVSTNLGAVLALSGRRTVILEFDIRKPKIMKGLGMQARDGLTSYIVGAQKLSDVLQPVPNVDNLYVLPCGPVPPNPAEMLLSDRVSELFAQLRQEFDAVIVDTAPVGLVSDGLTLGKHADAAIFIVRHNYTMKKQLQLIDDIYKQDKLPHMSVIINDISLKRGYGGYYGYGGYGYGYGYGYSSEYYDVAPKKGLLRRIFGRKKK